MKPPLRRRDFLKFTAVAGAAGIAGSALAQKTSLQSTDKKNGFIYRTLGRTGLQVPVISSGKIPVDNDDLAMAILNSGIIHIDSANRYDDGRNEEVLGRLLKKTDRKKFILATKIDEPTDKTTGNYTPQASAESFLNKFNESLQKLGTSYIDILYLHGLSSTGALLDERFTQVLINLKKEGKARYLGVSTHTNIPQIIHAATDSKIYDIVLFTYNFKQNNIADIRAAVAHAASAGLGTIAMKTQAGRFLDKENTLKVNSKAALKWALQDKNLHTIIISIKTYEQLNEYLSVMQNLSLTDEEKLFLDANSQSKTAMFCSGCSKCVEQCPFRLPIPDIMRAYMYSYGYHETREARKLMDELPVSPDGCNLCSECLIICPSGFNIQKKIADIARIKIIPHEFLV